MRFIFSTLLFAILLSELLNAQTYEIDAYNGQTITTCSGKFTDSRSSSSHYYDNEDFAITFCSGTGQLLCFDFGASSTYTNERIHPTDTLYIYNGSSVSAPLIVAVTGDPAAGNKLPYFGTTSTFKFLAPSDTITFRFVSDNSGNEDGWEAIISCVDKLSCNTNPDLSDLFGAAPTVCNFANYCGITSGNFGADYPSGLSGGGSCPTLFGGTNENNSWLIFQAANDTVSFDFEVTSCLSDGDGIQVAIFEYNGTTFTRKSDCSFSDGGHTGEFTVEAVDLTVGQKYYIMVDGDAGAVCEYTIHSTDNNNITSFNAGEDTTICNGDITNLTATSPSGISNFIWSWNDGSLNEEIGISIEISPIVTTTYFLTTSNYICQNSIDSITVYVDNCSLPVELINFTAEFKSNLIQIEWTTLSEFNNDNFVIEKSTDGSNFEAIGIENGHGNSNVINEYHFVDAYADKNILYYRLQQVDFNGTNHTIGSILKVENSQIDKPIITYSRLDQQLLISGIQHQSRLNVYDVQGRTIYQEIIAENEQGISIPIANINSNMFLIVELITESEVYKSKVLIN
ncbi:MAG: hypothetical protein JXR60_08365 [Bacteroidales bacterium]|nr:hypothetical protein [Bacteroidales bacterium]